MFKEGSGTRPVLVTLVYLFYTVAAIGAAALVVILLTGIVDLELPPGFTAASLAVEVPLFIFMAYGLRTGWKAGWAVTILMNVVWLLMDGPKLISGDMFIAIPVAIAAATLIVMVLKDTRRYFRLTS